MGEMYEKKSGGKICYQRSEDGGNGTENLRINWNNKSLWGRGCTLDTPPPPSPHLAKYIQDGNN
jgi:hypothetical protein